MKPISLTLPVVLWFAASASAAVRYVDAVSATPTPPYTNWATAARVIQNAVDVAAPGDEIVVTNGLYATGGRAVGTNVLVNRVAVDKPLTLRSVNGPEVTTIRGFKLLGAAAGCGNGAIRCVSLASGAQLSGFTLTNGATRTEGDQAAEQSGGGVHCDSAAAVVSNCVLINNGAWFGAGASGGTLTHCVLTNNSAVTNGGGAWGSALSNCILTRNSARAGEGGGACQCVLSNCLLTSNAAPYGSGAGASDSALDHCNLIANTARWYGGGALFGTLTHCALTNNSASLGGGACGASLTNCVLVANSAGSGGGNCAGMLDHCTLSGNRATDTNWWTGGGGAGGGTLVNCLLEQNSSAGDGGGVSGNWGMEGSPTAVLINCVLRGNSAHRGGGAYSGSLYNCTLTDNSAHTGGGANASSLLNCILYSNTNTNQASFAQSAYSFLDHCCTWPMPTSGVGNITNAPKFVDSAGGELRLQADSPCINAGNNASLTIYQQGWTQPLVNLTNLFDLDGNPRIVSGTVDIGAYEYQGSGSTISYAWLQSYGLPTDGSADLTDPDADGRTTWQEWRCQTDPTNALSLLRLLAASPSGTNFTVTWSSVSGVSYFLERSTNLSAAARFTLVATNLPGQFGTTSFTDTNAASSALLFYRVGVP